MNKTYLIILGLVLGSCKTAQKATTTAPGLEWTERENESLRTIAHGIPAYGKTDGVYKQKGNKKFVVHFGEPAVISVASKPEKWGFYQFPSIYRSVDGELVATWAMHSDHAESYGKDLNGFAVSKDGGKTWSVPNGSKPLGDGLVLPNGDRIKNYTPLALDTATLKLPKKVGISPETYGRSFSYYKLDELPENLKGVYLNRLKKGQTEWALEHSQLIDPSAVRYTDDKLFPVIWWGDMKVESSKDLMTGTYPGFSLQDGKVAASGVHFYRSVDQGKSWKIVGRIPYAPDLANDPNGAKRLALGFTEPAFEILKDGSYLCVLRTTDGLGNSPMYVSRSTDKGVTWSKPKAFASAGVLPKLLQLDNGVTVLASGRPGMQVRFSNGSNGREWTNPFEMLPFGDLKDQVSCGYPHLLSTGLDKFLLIYSDFKYKNEQGETRKAIKVREISVSAL